MKLKFEAAYKLTPGDCFYAPKKLWVFYGYKGESYKLGCCDAYMVLGQNSRYEPKASVEIFTYSEEINPLTTLIAPTTGFIAGIFTSLSKSYFY